MSIAKEIAGKWGLAGSTNLVLWGLLAVLVALGLGIAGGWWNGAKLARGKAEHAENKTLKADLKASGEFIARQQQVVADTSARYQAAVDQLSAISEKTAREREEDRRQMAAIRNQLEAALAARPDLARVHVGRSVLDAWNAANAGRAPGAAGAGAAAAADRPQPAAAKPRAAAAGPER